MNRLRQSWFDSRLRRAMLGQDAVDVFSGSRLLRPRSIPQMRSRVDAMLGTLQFAVLLLLPVMAVLSPKVDLSGEGLFVKADDVALLILLLCFLVRGKGARSSRIDCRVLVFLLLATVSLCRGILLGYVVSPGMGVATLAKYTEYFAVFYVVLTSLETEDQAWRLLRVFLLGAFAVAAYGILEHFFPYAGESFVPWLRYRVYERGHYSGDANHMGIFLAMSLTITIALAIWMSGFRQRIILYAASLAQIVAILYTGSRTAYVVAALSMTGLLVFRWKWRAPLALALVGAVVCLTAPEMVWTRITQVTLVTNEFMVSDDASLTGRLLHFRSSVSTVADYPLLGVGFGARHRRFYENQYLMLLAECGLVGLTLWLWILGGLGAGAVDRFLTATSNAYKGLAAGYVCALLCIMVSGLTVVSLTASRVAVPFWCLSALVYRLLDSGKANVSARLEQKRPL